MQYSSYSGLSGLRPTFYRALDAPTSHITLDEVKQHLGIFSAEFDVELTRIINAASEWSNDILGEVVGDTTFQAFYSQLDGRLFLGHKFVTTVISVTYFDASGNFTAVDAADYVFDVTSEYPSIVITAGSRSTSPNHRNPVDIQYLAGLPDAQYTDKIRQATLIIAADMFENKTSLIAGPNNPAYITATRLLGPLKKVLVDTQSCSNSAKT